MLPGGKNMLKKVLCWCLLILLIIPLPAKASLSDDVYQFTQKYSHIYANIDPALVAKMEPFLQDVVDYVVEKYDSDQVLNTQIKNGVASVLLTGEAYKNDLLPFMMEQAVNKELYQSQLTEMREIVRKEVQARLDAVNSPTGGGAVKPPATSVDPTSVEVDRQLAAGNAVISLTLGEDSRAVTITGATLQTIAAAGKELEITASGVTFRFPPQALNIASDSILAISARSLDATETSDAAQNLNSGQELVGPIYEFNSVTETNTQGVQFQKAVTVVLSYAGQDLTNITEDFLNAFYLNETTGNWVQMNGTVDKVNKTVSFKTTHFSKYAILFSPPATKSKFTDLPAEHWAYADINKMVGLGLVSGISSTEFAPERNITRAEFAALLVRALGIQPTVQIYGKFNDVPADKWCFNTVNTAADLGLLSGYSQNSFGPDDPVTREQMAVMITRALSYKGINITSNESEMGALSVFGDRQNISSWAVNGVNTAVKHGIIKGRSTVQFAPRENASRAEAAVMILRMYNIK
jgi:hypothetical protein